MNLLPPMVAGGFPEMSYTTRGDARYLVDDLAAHFVKKFIRQLRPPRGHEIYGFNGAQGHDVFVGTVIPYNLDRFDRQEYGEGLTDTIGKDQRLLMLE